MKLVVKLLARGVGGQASNSAHILTCWLRGTVFTFSLCCCRHHLFFFSFLNTRLFSLFSLRVPSIHSPSAWLQHASRWRSLPAPAGGRHLSLSYSRPLPGSPCAINTLSLASSQQKGWVFTPSSRSASEHLCLLERGF